MPITSVGLTRSTGEEDSRHRKDVIHRLNCSFFLKVVIIGSHIEHHGAPHQSQASELSESYGNSQRTANDAEETLGYSHFPLGLDLFRWNLEENSSNIAFSTLFDEIKLEYMKNYRLFHIFYD